MLCAITLALGVWTGLRWGMIAVQADARVTGTSWAEEGPSFKVLILDDGRALTIDDDLMDRLQADGPLRGRHVETEFGADTVVLDDREVPLTWPATGTRATALLAAICVVALVRHRRNDTRRAAAPGPGQVEGSSSR
jgi:hypothetical protein